MKENIINLEKKTVGEIELSDAIFGGQVNKTVLYDALRMQMSSKRQGNAATKNRALVSGSTRKIYRQKGTGRARHSDRRANIFVGGGKAFGPHPRDYSYAIPVKARRGAMCSALTTKQSEGKLLIVDKFDVNQKKTSVVAKIFEILGVRNGLVVTDQPNENLKRSTRNIPNMKVVCAVGLNLYDLLRHEHVVMTTAALNKVQEILKP